MMVFRDPLLNVLLAGFGLMCVYIILKYARQVWLIKFPNGENIVEDVTDADTPLFDEAETIARRLDYLGFQALGISKVTLAAYPNEPKYVWYYVNEAKTTHAQLVEFRPKGQRVLVGFITWFPDSALIETAYPLGENIEQPTFSAHFVRADLERGYSFHERKVEAWRKTHGEAVVIESIAQLVALDAVDRKFHRQWRYRRMVQLLLLSIAALSVTLLGICAAFCIIWLVDVPDLVVLARIHSTLVLFIFGGLVGFLVIYGQSQKPSGALDEGARKKVSDG